MKAEFIKSAAAVEHLPFLDKPEIAFAGRSNVGKSSLMNTILDRKNLVKTGKTPGKTRLLNFFNVGDLVTFVDLPGYGYAKVSKQEKESWGQMIEGYFRNRANLVMCLVLVDIRRSIEDDEKGLIELLNLYGIEPCIILTKADKLSRNQLMNNKFRHAKETGINAEKLIHFSAVTGEGKEEIRTKIEAAAAFLWK